MANHPSGPSVQLRRLAGELRALRDAAQLTRQEAMEQSGINDVTLYRIEHGKTRPQRRTLETLLDLYGVESRARDGLLDLASSTGFPGWIRPLRSLLGADATSYVSFEAEASSAHNYEAVFIPGLLQAEEYIRSMLTAGLPLATEESIETRVQLRLKRQSVAAERADPLRLWAIIDEAALRRRPCTSEIMSLQLTHLLEASERPEVTLQVIPFTTFSYPGLGGDFLHLRYDDPAISDIVYTENNAGMVYQDSPAIVREHEQIFDHMRAVALSPEDTRQFISSVRAE